MPVFLSFLLIFCICFADPIKYKTFIYLLQNIFLCAEQNPLCYSYLFLSRGARGFDVLAYIECKEMEQKVLLECLQVWIRNTKFF